MTRNIYPGGDIAGPLNATAGLSGPAALLAFGRADERHVVGHDGMTGLGGRSVSVRPRRPAWR